MEYDGAGFAGWQQQKGGRTVEAELKKAIAAVTGTQVKVYGAGRTDAGAHAEGQVASFELERGPRVERLAAALNAHLPVDVSVLSAEEAAPGFHARFSAKWRRYRYRFLDRPGRPALDSGRCWHVRQRLSVPAMRTAAKSLVGAHDWTTFCSASEPRESRIRKMRRVTVTRSCDHVDVALEAEGFLRGLARSIAGALAEVGLGRRQPEWVNSILRARDRNLALRTAPAGGLTLMEVIY